MISEMEKDDIDRLTAVVWPDVKEILDELHLLVEVERQSSVLVEMW